jgi:hypothetical protein
MNKSKKTILLVTVVLLVLLGGMLHAAKRGNDKVKDLVFQPGQTSVTVEGNLAPYAKHIYKFRARAGQTMTVQLRVRGGSKQDATDLAFWIQTCKYVKGRDTLMLDGIDISGKSDKWSGTLPADGEYEIYVSNPPYSDHVVKHIIRYALEVSIK